MCRSDSTQSIIHESDKGSRLSSSFLNTKFIHNHEFLAKNLTQILETPLRNPETRLRDHTDRSHTVTFVGITVKCIRHRYNYFLRYHLVLEKIDGLSTRKRRRGSRKMARNFAETTGYLTHCSDEIVAIGTYRSRTVERFALVRKYHRNGWST